MCWFSIRRTSLTMLDESSYGMYMFSFLVFIPIKVIIPVASSGESSPARTPVLSPVSASAPPPPPPPPPPPLLTTAPGAPPPPPPPGSVLAPVDGE